MSKLFLTIVVIILALPAVWLPIASSRAGAPAQVMVGKNILKGLGVSNGLIALTLRDQNGKLQIFTITPDGTNRKHLTFDGDNGRPDWSPDGKQIAFGSIRNGKQWVAVMDADGSNQKLLAEGNVPDWAPDGKQIAFSRPDDRQIVQIWVMNADGSNIRQITQSNTVKIAPSWSPDGKEMVFILPKNPGSPSDPQPEIGIMNADGTNERILTTADRVNVRVNPDGSTTVCETANDANAPAWSPVDNKITFWSGIENQYGQVWSINSDGTGSKQLTEDCGHRNSDDPSWSPDGKKILFSTGRSGRNELWVMDADGSNEKRISDIDASPFPGRASWQPSSVGTGRMAFVSRQSSVNHIYLMDVDASGRGSNPTRLTRDGETESFQSWSPDGKRLVYQRAFNGSAIYVINADGAGQQRLSPTPGFDATPSWSPDGAKIVYVRLLAVPQPGQPPPLTDIRVMNADGTNDHAVLANTVFSVEPKWSVNDQLVFMSLMNGSTLDIYVINVDGTGLRQLTSAAGNNGDPVWSPDGTRITFGSDREGGNKLNIFAMNADGSQVEQLTHFDAPYEAGDTNWSSDGKKIAFQYDINGNKQSDPNAYAEVWTMNPDGSGATSTGVQCSNVGCHPQWQPVATLPRAVANVSAASYLSTSLAPESIVSTFGSGLATATLAAASTPLPTTLAGATVKVRDSAGAERLAPLFFVSPTQVNYQIPAGTANGASTVSVTSGDGSISTGTAQIAPVAPGLFSADASGSGLAAALALRVKADGSQQFEPVAQFDPAQNKFVAVPIDLGPETDQVFLILFGTGLRFRSALSAVTAGIGGVDCQAPFAGAQGGFAGLDQVNVRLSRSLIGRGGVDVALTVDGKPANTIKASIK